jgi:sorting nexin-29
LLCVSYKILSVIIYNRITPLIEDKIGDYQCGFRGNRSTVDQIFAVRQTLDKTWEYEISIWFLFIDFKSAYDQIERKAVVTAMRRLDIPQKLIKLTKMTMRKTKNVIKVNKCKS